MNLETDLTPGEDKNDSLEEISSDGKGTGIEAERTAETPSAPFDPTKIDIITVIRTVDLLLDRLTEGELDLSPEFQRRSNLWSEETKSALLESILLRIPIPSLYVSEDENGNYTVVDGLQRLCAISHFVKVEALNKAVKKKFDPLRLKNLESLKEFNDKSFAELVCPLQRRINETELTLHVIRAGTPPNVKFSIFSRINRGGLPLTAQEIRNAIYDGCWKKEIKQLAESPAFKTATNDKIKGERMEDLELVLRFVALFTQQKQDPTYFSSGDIINLSMFANKIKDNADALSSYIKENLSNATATALINYSISNPDSAQLETGLLLDLNKIVDRQLIYDDRRFDHVHLRSETRTLLNQYTTKDTLQRLNRALLEDAYPQELSRSQKYVMRPPDQNLDDFLNSFVEHTCAKWPPEKWLEIKLAFERALIYSTQIFKWMAFRKYSEPGKNRRPINRGLFEAETVAIARLNLNQIDELASKSEEVIRKFGYYFNKDKGFQDSLLYATGRGMASNKRIEIMNQIFTEVLK